MWLIAIDPGTDNIGLAIFHDDTIEYCYSVRCRGASRSADWRYKVLSIAASIRRLVGADFSPQEDGPFIVVLECPAYWTSHKGQKSLHSESVQKVYFAAGALAYCFAHSFNPDKIYAIEPIAWKGNVPKHVTINRVNRALYEQFGSTITDHNAADAAWLALTALRMRNDDGTLPKKFTLIYDKSIMETMPEVFSF